VPGVLSQHAARGALPLSPCSARQVVGRIRSQGRGAARAWTSAPRSCVRVPSAEHCGRLPLTSVRHRRCCFLDERTQKVAEPMSGGSHTARQNRPLRNRSCGRVAMDGEQRSSCANVLPPGPARGETLPGRTPFTRAITLDQERPRRALTIRRPATTLRMSFPPRSLLIENSPPAPTAGGKSFGYCGSLVFREM